MASKDTEFGSSELDKISYSQDYVNKIGMLFNNSPKLNLLILSILEVLDKQQDDLLWLSNNILNIDVAEKYHLDFIGNFVGQKRVLASFDTGVFFGFEEAYQAGTFGDSNNPEVGAVWNNGNSYDASTSKILNDEQYKRIIRARIIKNNTRTCSINDLIEVSNLITGNSDTSINQVSHGHLQIKVNDTEGLFAYFMSRLYNKDNIIPLALGVRLEMVE